MFHPEHILVTGGCGFMGSNFVRWVAREHPGVRMTVLDALTYAGSPANLDGLPEGRVDLVIGDICDGALVDGLMARADACVHFAAETHVPRQVTNVLRGARPVLYGDGSAVRDWIHVDDHSSAVWEILTRGRIGETYLVGGVVGGRQARGGGDVSQGGDGMMLPPPDFLVNSLFSLIICILPGERPFLEFLSEGTKSFVDKIEMLC